MRSSPRKSGLQSRRQSPSLDIEGTLRRRGHSYNGYPVSAGYLGSLSIDGLALALHSVYHSRSFGETIETCVNHLGDADSAAAIAGLLRIDLRWRVCAISFSTLPLQQVKSRALFTADLFSLSRSLSRCHVHTDTRAHTQSKALSIHLSTLRLCIRVCLRPGRSCENRGFFEVVMMFFLRFTTVALDTHTQRERERERGTQTHTHTHAQDNPDCRHGAE